MWRSITYKLPLSSEFSTYEESQHNTRTKEKEKLRVPLATKSAEDWFSWKGPKIWNLLPLMTRQETNKIKAKKSIKSFASEYAFV